MKKLLNYQGNLKQVEKLIDVTAWTHWYHQPYKSDWREARIKALDRLWKLRGDKYGQ